ncbi:WD40 repeat domain-containing protein [Pedobacter yulinensis]|uniref:WD40 repeat domain-containing protein n=1 Tax=Pedobacter yulinensis TaxID=2126353 RepID=A0A2T3HHA8_9SPHI|nr:WD40 repeat domain-containing protein [Pedobacter yulinensis]PST81783.1 WD40 repeat domain-containing protein [Pedobacter yulinensis]
MLSLNKTLPGHQNPVYALAVHPEQPKFYTAGNDKGVVEWSAVDFSFTKVLTPVSSSVYALHFFAGKLFAAQKSGLIEAIDPETGGRSRMDAHGGAVFGLQGIAGKQELLSSGENGQLTVWDARSLEKVYQFSAGSDTARCMALSPNGAEIAVGCKDHIIRVYDTSDYSLLAELSGHKGAITSLAFSPDGSYLLSGSRDAQVKKWAAGSFVESASLAAHLFAVYGIVFHPDRACFATCSQDKSIKIWNSEDFRLLRILSLEKSKSGHSHSVNKIAWLPDGAHLVSTGDDRLVQVWSWD